MANAIRFAVFPLIISLFLSGCSDGSDRRGPEEDQGSTLLVKGAPLVGGANGMFFDPDDRLFVGNVYGQTISVLDPDTGEILEQLGNPEGVQVGADDLTFDAFGTLYWTDPAAGKVMGRSTEGDTFIVAEGFPLANPITVSDDGRLFFAQCFAAGSNGLFEADPMGIMLPTTIRGEDQECSSNGMDWRDEKLFSPRWFEGRIVTVDTETGELTDVTTNWGIPTAVKFNSLGELHAVNQGNGEVVRIDIETGERQVLARFPDNWLDNLAFDSNDRLFVSSASEGTVAEVLEDGEIREVIPGGMIIPMGLTLIDDVLYTTEFQSIRGFNTQSGKQVGGFSFSYGMGPISTPTNVSSVGEYLVLLSFASNELLVWDMARESEVVKASFIFPADAAPFEGDLLVSEFALGRVVRARMPHLSERETVADGLAFPAGLAANDKDVYVSDSAQGKVFLIIRDGEVLSEPEEIAAGFDIPEGISLNSDSSKLLVVEGGSSTLTEITLATGERTIIAEELDFQPSGSIPGLITHWINDVEVDDNDYVYVNSDGGNAIYKFPL